MTGDRILWNRRPTPADNGDIDEIVVHRPQAVHIEQMDARCWWIAIHFDEERYWTGVFIADGKGRMRFVQQEDAGAEWATDQSHELGR